MYGYYYKNRFYDYVQENLNKYVEVHSYFSSCPLYGEIIEADSLSITLCSRYIDESNPTLNETYTLYLPLSSIISIRTL
ncbi:ATPase [Clostridioides difficile]|nr:ATPase [Clostridioides difficile]